MPQGLELPPKPKTHMSNGKAAAMIAVAIVFDALKLMCEFLVLFAPAFAAIGAYIAAGGGVLGDVGAAIAAATAGTAEALGAVVPLEALGMVLGMIIGFIGWLLFVLWFFGSGINLFARSSRFLTTLIGWMLSEVPFIDALPTLTLPIIGIIHSVREEDRENLAKWEAEVAELQQKFLRAQQIQLIQRQMNETRAANDALYESQLLEAANDESYANPQPESANDAAYAPEEIPEEFSEAA